MTFTLQGFTTVKREGIELTGSFAATVNAEMRVGSVTETITVTGESPIVDVQSTTQQRVIDKESSTRSRRGEATSSWRCSSPASTGARPDVGGSNTLGWWR